MAVTRLRLRDFRCYASAELALGPGLTVIHGRNGAGKTNVLEGLYFGLTSRSCRTTNEREVVRFGASAARVEGEGTDEGGPHEGGGARAAGGRRGGGRGGGAGGGRGGGRAPRPAAPPRVLFSFFPPPPRLE